MTDLPPASPSPVHRFASSLAVALLTASAVAQCGSGWTSLAGFDGADDRVLASVLWDPDGAGPAGPRLVVGGAFRVIGDVVSPAIAMLDLATGTWSTMNGGMARASSPPPPPLLPPLPVVNALVVLPNGDLVAGGFFDTAGGVPAIGIARWNGSQWQAFDASPLGIQALKVTAGGQLVAAGSFGDPAPNHAVAVWSGASWTPLGGRFDNWVFAVDEMTNGDLVAGGWFTTVGGQPARFLARWDGAQWTQFHRGIEVGVQTLLALPNGELVVGGGFVAVDGDPAAIGVVRWDGATWRAIGTGVANVAKSLARAPNGDLLVGGSFLTAGGVAAQGIARWNGTAWSAVGTSLPAGGTHPQFYGVNTMLTLPNGELLAGGAFRADGGANLARFVAGEWESPTRGAVGTVHTSLRLADGSLVVAGGFTSIGGITARRIARRSAGVWSPLGSGISGQPLGQQQLSVRAVTQLPNGDLIVGGHFQSAGGTPVANVARWDGSTWHALGAGPGSPDTTVSAVVVRPNGEILAAVETFSGISSGPWRWNGATWQNLTSSSFWIRGMVTAPNGNVWIGGSGGLVEWDGVAFTARPCPIVSIFHLSLAANGDLLVAGSSSAGSPVARLQQGTWQTFVGTTSHTARTVVELPDGGLLISKQGGSVLQWRGGNWLPVGAVDSGEVRSLFVTEDERVYVGGDFTSFAGVVSPGLVEFATTCRPQVVASGSGCTGSGGPLALAASSSPWLGRVFRSAATGLPANGLAIELLGLAELSVPLAALLPEGQPGCSLWASPDALAAYAPVAGVVSLQLVVPRDPLLLGATLRQQVVVAELGSAGLTSLTSTNALVVTFGGY